MPNILALSDQALAAVRKVVHSAGSAFGGTAGVVDREFNLLACSDPVSPLRGFADWAARLRRIGGFASARPVWLPPGTAPGAPGTVWAPIRCDRRLLGFLWLVHTGAPPSRQETQRAGFAAREIAGALSRGCVDQDVLMQELLCPDTEARKRATRRLLDEHPKLADLGVAALVAAETPDAGGPGGQSLRDAVRRHPFRLHADSHCALIIPGSAANVELVANRLAAATGAVVGVGEWYPDVWCAYQTYREALGAARTAIRLTDADRVVQWTSLGPYRAFALLPDDVLTHSSVHAGLEQLFAESAHQPLLTTLETYLDLAGNVPAAARRLHLHRASLYYRLRRVEQLLQADLRDGSQRLCLHMAFKLGRLTGRYPLRRHAPSRTPTIPSQPRVHPAEAS